MTEPTQQGKEPEEAFDVPEEHIVLSSKGRGWNGFDVAEIVHPLENFALPAISRHVLVINLGSAQTIKEELVGRQGAMRPGCLTILPAEAPSHWHIDRDEEIHHLHLYLPPRLLHNIAAEANIYPDQVEIIDTLGTHDPQIEYLAMQLLAELRSDGLGGRMYAEALAQLLAIQLLRNHSTLKPKEQPVAGRLSQPQLKTTLAYIEDHLGAELSLNELAAVVHLSPYHFARLFKASTGLSPHQYVLQRRVERAKLLIATTERPLSAIAHEVGFTSESHLTTHFKRLTGLTPRQYR